LQKDWEKLLTFICTGFILYLQSSYPCSHYPNLYFLLDLYFLLAQTKLQLFDLTGRMVLAQELRERSERIDVSALNKGMYLYRVASGKERLGSGKVVIE
jgi:hypothetical protein